MFGKLFKILKAQDMAIDLGTANTVVYVKDRGIVLNEPSVVAKLQMDGSMEFGHKAKLMLGKTPSKIDARRPMKDGVIADFNFAQEMIKHYVRQVNKGRMINSPMIVICVPSSATPVDRRAIQDAAENGGGNPVFLIEEPMAAAIGANLPVSEPTGSMVIDIGGGTTEIAVLCLGGIVYSCSIRVGGDKIDEVIINYIRRHHNLLIGESTAEKIKIAIGRAKVVHKLDNGEEEEEEFEDKTIQVKGRDLINGIPKEIILASSDLSEALVEPVKQIIDATRSALETIPPELSSDIVEHGICLTGGGALIQGLDKAIANATDLRVFVAENPLFCVALGTGIALENPDIYKHALFRQD